MIALQLLRGGLSRFFDAPLARRLRMTFRLSAQQVVQCNNACSRNTAERTPLSRNKVAATRRRPSLRTLRGMVILFSIYRCPRNRS